MAPSQVEIVGLGIAGVPLQQPLLFVSQQRDPQLADHGARNLVLNGEHVAGRAVEAVRPEMAAVGGVDELHRDAQAVPDALYAAFEDRADVELPADLAHVHRLALEGEGRGPSDDTQPAQARESVGQFLRQAVAEILLVLFAGHVRERQHGNRGLRHGAVFV